MNLPAHNSPEREADLANTSLHQLDVHSRLAKDDGAVENSAVEKCRATAHPNLIVRWAFISGGWLALALGAIGVVVPLLPTTPFILLAALLFSRGSPHLHSWLCSTRIAGKIITDWEAHGVIRTRAKVISTVMMVTLMSYPIFFREMPIEFKVIAVLTMAGVLTFIWTRPSRAACSNSVSGKGRDRPGGDQK